MLVPSFHILRITQALFNGWRVNEHLGMTQYLQGNMALAEIFTPAPDEAILVMGDEEPELMSEIFLCNECWGHVDFLLPALQEMATDHKEKTDKQKAGIKD
jgi:hypothetical protein